MLQSWKYDVCHDCCISRFLSHLDVDMAGNVDLRKSTLGYLNTFARVAVA